MFENLLKPSSPTPATPTPKSNNIFGNLLTPATEKPITKLSDTIPTPAPTPASKPLPIIPPPKITIPKYVNPATLDPATQPKLSGDSTLKISQAPPQTAFQVVADKINKLFEPVANFATNLTPRERLAATQSRIAGDQEMGTTTIKIPFTQAQIPLQNNFVTNTAKFIAEFPERIVNDVKDSFSGPNAPADGQIKVNSYLDDANAFYQEAIKAGMSESGARTASVMYGVGQGLFDISIVGGLLESAAKGVLKGAEVNLAQKEAWEVLNQPVDLEEAKTQRNLQAHQFHPDVPVTGDTAKFQATQNAYKTLEKYGIPKDGNVMPTVRDIARKYLDAIGSKYPTIQDSIISNRKLLQEGSNLSIEPDVSETITMPGVDKNPDLQDKIDTNIREYQRSGGYGGVGTPTADPMLRDLHAITEIPEGKALADKTVTNAISSGLLKPDTNGKITVYRVGNTSPLNPLTSVTYSEDFAKTFDRSGKAPITSFQVYPKDISYFIGGPESELLLKKTEVDAGSAAAKYMKATMSPAEYYARNIERKLGGQEAITKSPKGKALLEQRLAKEEAAGKRIELKNQVDTLYESLFKKSPEEISAAKAVENKTPAEITAKIQEIENKFKEDSGMQSAAGEVLSKKKQLIKDIRSVGGISAFKNGVWKTEMRDVPVAVRNTRGGKLDQVLESLNANRGYNFQSESEIIDMLTKPEEAKNASLFDQELLYTSDLEYKNLVDKRDTQLENSLNNPIDELTPEYLNSLFSEVSNEEKQINETIKSIENQGGAVGENERKNTIKDEGKGNEAAKEPANEPGVAIDVSKASTAELRTRYDELSSMLDTTEGQVRQEVVAQLNDVQDKLNTLYDTAEKVIEVKRKGALNLADVKVFEYSDGKWGASHSVNAGNSGQSSPIHGEYATKEEAIAAQVKVIDRFVKNNEADANGAGKAELKKIEDAIAPYRKEIPASLFDQVEEKIQEAKQVQAEADWEEKYAEKYGQLSNEYETAARELKTAQVADKQALMEKMAVAADEILKIEEKFAAEQEKFSVKEYGRLMPKGKVVAELRKLFPEKEVQILTQKNFLMSNNGKTAYGSSMENLIKLVENDGKISDKVAYHEAFHQYFQKFVSAEDRATYLEHTTEEKLADNFADFYAKRKTFTGRILQFFKDLLAKIRQWISGKKNVESLFGDIADVKRPAVVDNTEAILEKYKEAKLTKGQDAAAAEMREIMNDLQAGRITEQQAVEQLRVQNDKFMNDPNATESFKEVDSVPQPEKQTPKLGIGLDKFFEQDLKPGFKGVVNGTAKTWDLIKKTFVPSARGEEAQLAASILRKNIGVAARRKEIVFQQLVDARKTFDKYSKEESLAFMDKLESGADMPESRKFTGIIREAMGSRWGRIQAIKNTEAYIENYFPHIWKDPAKASETLAKFYSKRPFEGSKGFLKQRTIPTISEGVKLGLEPMSYNPVDLVLAKIVDMDKFLMAHDTWEEFKDNKLNKFVALGDKAPVDWARVNDKIAQVFYKPTIKESYDTEIMDALNKIASDFGIKHERVISGKGLGRNLGISKTGKGEIVSKFATPEDVILHELGHQLDPIFDMQEKIKFKDAPLSTKTQDTLFPSRQTLKEELRALADSTGRPQSWTRKSEEKVAIMFQAYMHAPEHFKQIAPHVYDEFVKFLDSDPRLKPITEIKPSLRHTTKEYQMNVLAKGGDWYMPEQAATILNNYLSPGLMGNPIYNAFRMAGNTLNQVQLGLSAFHAVFTSGDAVVSKSALELQKIFSNTSAPSKLASALKIVSSPVAAPYYAFKNLIRGNKLLTNYFKENPEIPHIVDALEKAGGRVRMDQIYKNDSVTGFFKALRSGNYVGAAVRTPGAAIEAMAKPIMEWLVPRQKLGVFSDMASHILEQAAKESWPEQKSILRLQEAWDSVDNRLGQMVYDNLFWNKVLKDLGMASTRSLGWNLGTIRELGGGVAQIAGTPINMFTAKGRAKIRMTPKMAYTLVLPFIIGAWGAMIYYMYNGKGPDTLLDYYYPKTGRLKPDGTEERIALPSYMKDVFAYAIKPTQTIANKTHPLISTMIDMLENKDYYGVEIRNTNDPLVKQFGDEFKYLAQQYVPFSVQGAIQRKNSGGGLGAQAESFFGLTPAPSYITKAGIQTKISDTYSQRFGSVQTQEQFANSKVKSNIRNLYLQGKLDEANTALNDAVDKGIIKEKGIKTFMRNADIPSDVRAFTALPKEDQLGLMKGMSVDELKKYAWYSKDLSISQLSQNAKTFVQMVKDGQAKKPVWKQGKNINP